MGGSGLRKRLGRSKRFLLGLLVMGGSVFCPCCGHTFRRFLMFAGLPGQQCPRCGSLARHRLMWIFIKEMEARFKPGSRVLHFAPEEALGDFMPGEKGLRVTFDISNKYSPMVRGDIQHLPFRADTFDAIICSHVLEHVPDDARAMGELADVLKTGGWALIQVPIDRNRAKTLEDWEGSTPSARARVFGLEDHLRLYGLDFYSRLEEAGFNVSKLNLTGLLSPQAAMFYGLKDHILCICTKNGEEAAPLPSAGQFIDPTAARLRQIRDEKPMTRRGVLGLVLSTARLVRLATRVSMPQGTVTEATGAAFNLKSGAAGPSEAVISETDPL